MISILGGGNMFVNREAELAHLEQRYDTDQAEMYVLHGTAGGGQA